MRASAQTIEVSSGVRAMHENSPLSAHAGTGVPDATRQTASA
jgi:hypothetical protein